MSRKNSYSFISLLFSLIIVQQFAKDCNSFHAMQWVNFFRTFLKN